MRDVPIIFSAPMVRALIREVVEPGNGKTQTRRIAWRKPIKIGVGKGAVRRVHGSPWQNVNPGDRVWVRENFRVEEGGVIRDGAGGQMDRIETSIIFGADGIPVRRLTPSIHMPRRFSRLTLVLTGAKIERLNDISEEDCKREGVLWDGKNGWWEVPGVSLPSGAPIYNATAREAFACLWDTVNGSGAWLENPEVVALSFKVYLSNIDAMEKAV